MDADFRSVHYRLLENPILKAAASWRTKILSLGSVGSFSIFLQKKEHMFYFE